MFDITYHSPFHGFTTQWQIMYIAYSGFDLFNNSFLPDQQASGSNSVPLLPPSTERIDKQVAGPALLTQLGNSEPLECTQLIPNIGSIAHGIPQTKLESELDIIQLSSHSVFTDDIQWSTFIHASSAKEVK